MKEPKVKDIGEWKGIKLEEWLERMMKGHAEDGTPAMSKRETLPLIKKRNLNDNNG